MIITYLKYVFIIFDGMYVFPKTLNISISKSHKSAITLSLYTLLLPLVTCFLRQYVLSLSLILIVAISVITFSIVYKVNTDYIITATIISYGISYIAYAVSSLIVSIIFCVLDQLSYSPIFAITVGIIQVIFVFSLFRLRRLTHGLTFLADSRYSSVGVFISISILMAFSFLGMQQEIHLIYEILTASIFICGVALWLWWKDRIKQEYIEQLRKRDFEEVNSTVAVQREEIEFLKRENDKLSKIIHKDNKLIPALNLSVKEFLLITARKENQQARISDAQKMVTQLERISCERYGILKSYELSSKKLPSSGIPILDTLFSYMFQKATAANIDFDLSIWSDLKPMIGTVVTEQDASTVLADLIENAIIATEQCNCKKRILIGLGLLDNYYSISVSDSGVPFPNEVIENWGIKRITTHADNGGSGIGMMSTYEICKRYSASFSIETFGPDMLYSKRITICFDNANQFVSDKS